MIALATVFVASCAHGGEQDESVPGVEPPTARIARSSSVLEGTVFWGPSRDDPVDRAFVHLVDAGSTTRCVVTACDGTFSLSRADARALTLPIRIVVERAKEPELRIPLTLAFQTAPDIVSAVSKMRIDLFATADVAAAQKLPPTGSCAPGAVRDVVVCPEDRF